jgi:cobyric acid synthase
VREALLVAGTGSDAGKSALVAGLCRWLARQGGVFAAMFGTLALLEPADQALISGIVINKFRAAPEALAAGRPPVSQRARRRLD